MLGSCSRRAVAFVVIALLAVVPSVVSQPAAVAAPGYFPAEWSGPSAVIGARLSDGGGSGIDGANSYVSLDGQRLVSRYRSGALTADARGMAVGVHTASIHAVDRAGNAMDFSWEFKVEMDAPVVWEEGPTGTINDHTPELWARVSDASAGIDPAWNTITLVWGDMSTTFAPEYDPATGIMRHQVPLMPSGIGIGHAPLVDGEYLMIVSVRDRAGHTTQSTSSFIVDTLAGHPPIV